LDIKYQMIKDETHFMTALLIWAKLISLYVHHLLKLNLKIFQFIQYMDLYFDLFY